MCVTSTAAQMPFDYQTKQQEQINEAKELEPFHVSNRSGLSLIY
jgi:hypothetical protein